MHNWENRKTNAEILELNRAERLHQTNVSKYGFPMEIIEYRNAEDIDVLIDGVVVKHKSYKKFVNGDICKTRNDIRFFRKNEVSTNTKGLLMTIIEYRTADDIDIQFEDGTIVYHKDYHAFKVGNIKNPNYVEEKPVVIKPIKPSIGDKRIGETNRAINGQMMTIIAYRQRKDIDIQFEDGTIVEHKRYQHFLTGEIANPNVRTSNSTRTDRIGESITTADGVVLTICGYRNGDDIDIRLPDNTIIEHKEYEDFINGTIVNTHAYKRYLAMGETITNANGQTVKIICYRTATDIDVEFDDGYVIRHIRYAQFKEAKLRHPMHYMIGDIEVERLAYTYKDERNYMYICKKCHHHDIGNINEIREHICKEIPVYE